MKKVVLLGDSIRLWGYGTKVPEMLGEEYTVYQPEDNCRFTKYTLRGMFDWQDGIKGADIIHWNNGLWDATELFGDGTFTTEEEYISDCTRIARILKKITPNVIFATTTPVWDEFEYTHNDKIKRFNEIIVPVLEAEGVVINDLYSAVASDIHKYIKECDKIHLSDEGIDLCAGLVVEKIKSFE
ncbi:MAG: SGNH/GDSL hydrolase family protein [Clostridia bacterium]|nr:SGNH/GDSL hydrolase family protein [Clostridia bacterium]MBQ8566712.1 SGNH/GDSL hydrolase family protein [Clostridia bacterium]